MTGLEIVGLIFIALCILCITESDWGLALFFGAVLMVGLGIAKYQGFFSPKELIHYVTDDWFRTSLIVLGYFIIGCFYMALRWYWYAVEWVELHNKDYPVLEAKNEVERLARLGMFWPIGLPWNIIRYPFRNVWKAIIRKYAYILDNISKAVYAKAHTK